MNVMVYNKFKEELLGLKIEVMKSLEGVYNVDEIIDTFTNFYYDKMILDITAIRDYQNVDNLQKLAMNINMENVIVLLDDTPETNSESYISSLVSLGIYNFTKNVDGINYLLVHPHSYRDVVNVKGVQDMSQVNQANQVNQTNSTPSNVQVPTPVAPVMQEMPANNGRMKIIGFKNITNHAGATTLIYMLKKELQKTKNVAAIEVNRVDFLYFNEKNMISTTSQDLAREINSRNTCDIILVDLNDYEDLNICSEVYFLIEPSTIMVNRMLKKNKGILESLSRDKIVLNKCILSKQDVATFEYETKLKVIDAIPYVDDRQDNIAGIKNFIGKVNM